MSEVVIVTGTPRLQLNIGGTLVQANYVSGSGTNTLLFNYTIVAGNTDANGISINANALTLNGGTIRDASNNNAVLTAGTVADNANFLVDTTGPNVQSVTSSPTLGNTGATSTITIVFSEAVQGLDLGDLSADKGLLSNLQGSGTTYTVTYTRTGGNGSVKLDVGTGYLDLAGNTGAAFQSANLPAGVAGSPINLALEAVGGTVGLVTVTIDNMPAGWTLDGGTQNADGSWTITSADIGSLTVTTPADYSGAEVLNVNATWINADGSAGACMCADNVEAYAPGNPIFAWSGDDTLTGSGGRRHVRLLAADRQRHGAQLRRGGRYDRPDRLFRFRQLRGLQAHMAPTANGNAVITLANGQSITLDGVSASQLTAANFVFDAGRGHQ